MIASFFLLHRLQDDGGPGAAAAFEKSKIQEWPLFQFSRFGAMAGRGCGVEYVREFCVFGAVFNIYRYLSGIYHFLINFSSGMVWWYAKVVLVSFDLNSVSSGLISNSREAAVS